MTGYGEASVTYGFTGGTYGSWGDQAAALIPADSGGAFRPAGVDLPPNRRRFDDDDVLFLI